MDVSITLALIALATVVVTGVITPIAVGYVQYRIRIAERAQDKAERQTIADKVEQVADAQTDRVDNVDRKLEQIHGLVNSRLTAIMHSLLDALTGQISALRDNVSQDEAAGKPASEARHTAINVLEKRAAELESVLSLRDK